MSDPRLELSDGRSLAQKLYGQCRVSSGPFKALTGSIRKLRNALEELEDVCDNAPDADSLNKRLLDHVKDSNALLRSLDLAIQHYRASATKDVDSKLVPDSIMALDDITSDILAALDPTSPVPSKVPEAKAADETESEPQHDAQTNNGSDDGGKVVAQPLHEDKFVVDMSEEKIFVDLNSPDALQRSSNQWAMGSSALPSSWQSPFAAPDPLLSIGIEEATFRLLSEDNFDDSPDDFYNSPGRDRSSSHCPSTVVGSNIKDDPQSSSIGPNAWTDTYSLSPVPADIYGLSLVPSDVNGKPKFGQDDALSTFTQGNVAGPIIATGLGITDTQTGHSLPNSVLPHSGQTTSRSEAISKQRDNITGAKVLLSKLAEHKPTTQIDESTLQRADSGHVQGNATTPSTGPTVVTPLLLVTSPIESRPSSSNAEKALGSAPTMKTPANDLIKTSPQENSTSNGTPTLSLEYEDIFAPLSDMPSSTTKSSPTLSRRQGKPRRPSSANKLAKVSPKDPEHSDDELYSTSQPSSPLNTKLPNFPAPPVSQRLPPPGPPPVPPPPIPNGHARTQPKIYKSPSTERIGLSNRGTASPSPSGKVDPVSTILLATRADTKTHHARNISDPPPIPPPKNPPPPPPTRASPGAPRNVAKPLMTIADPGAAIDHAIETPSDSPRVEQANGATKISPKEVADVTASANQVSPQLPLRTRVPRVAVDDALMVERMASVKGNPLTPTQSEQKLSPAPSGKQGSPYLPSISTSALSERDFAGFFGEEADNDTQMDLERIQHCVHFWNEREWAQAELYLSDFYSQLIARDDFTAARRVQHLLGVCASLSGRFNKAVDRFLAVLQTPIKSLMDLDPGDCAAAYWLADIYALRNQRVEAALAYSLAALGPYFHERPQPDLIDCVLAEVNAVMLGVPRQQFIAQWKDKTADPTKVVKGSILDPAILVPEAVARLLDDAFWSPRRKSTFRLQSNTDRADSLRNLYKGPVPQSLRQITIDEGSFSPYTPWPMPFDPYFSMAHVQQGRLIALECDMLQLFQSNSEAKIVRTRAMNMNRTDCVNSNDLSWLITAVRECLRICELDWTEVANTSGTWFVIRYPLFERSIATTRYCSISLFKHTLRSGYYGAEICPDGFSSSRILNGGGGGGGGGGATSAVHRSISTAAHAHTEQMKEVIRDCLQGVVRQRGADGKKKSYRPTMSSLKSRFASKDALSPLARGRRKPDVGEVSAPASSSIASNPDSSHS